PAAEFHACPPWRDPLSAGQDVLLARAGDGKPGRELQQDRAELAGLAQRLQRCQQPVPRLTGPRRVDVFQAHPVLAGLLRSRAQVSGQRRDAGGVLGKQSRVPRVTPLRRENLGSRRAVTREPGCAGRCRADVRAGRDACTQKPAPGAGWFDRLWPQSFADVVFAWLSAITKLSSDGRAAIT